MMHKSISSYSILDGLNEMKQENSQEDKLYEGKPIHKVHEGSKDTFVKIPGVPKGAVRVFYDNLNRRDFLEEHMLFVKKLKKFIRLSFGDVGEDDISHNLRVYIEVSELVGMGQSIDIYIYGFREECGDEETFRDIYGPKTQFLKKFSKMINHFVGTPSEIDASVLWRAKIEIKRRPESVGPYLFYRFTEKDMPVEDYKQNRDLIDKEDEE